MTEKDQDEIDTVLIGAAAALITQVTAAFVPVKDELADFAKRHNASESRQLRSMSAVFLATLDYLERINAIKEAHNAQR